MMTYGILTRTVCKMNVKSIVSPEVLFIMLLVAAAGYFIMSKIVNKKYGYTKKREKELENIDEKKGGSV